MDVDRMKRYLHDYRKEYGGWQYELIHLYFLQGKNIDEIQELLKCPRASVRGRLSEIKRAVNS